MKIFVNFCKTGEPRNFGATLGVSDVPPSCFREIENHKLVVYEHDKGVSDFEGFLLGYIFAFYFFELHHFLTVLILFVLRLFNLLLFWLNLFRFLRRYNILRGLRLDYLRF